MVDYVTRLLVFSTFVLLSFSAHAKDAVTIVGRWYDDVGSPAFLDATFIIESEGRRFFVHRKNGDGSEGRYGVERSKNTYTRIGDKFDAKYIITPKGLELHDRAGYIRTARPLK